MKMRIATKTCRECRGTGTADKVDPMQSIGSRWSDSNTVSVTCEHCNGEGTEPRIFVCNFCEWTGPEHRVEGVGCRDEYRDVCPECGGIECFTIKEES